MASSVLATASSSNPVPTLETSPKRSSPSPADDASCSGPKRRCLSPPKPLAVDDIQRFPDEILRHIFSFLHPRRRISVEGVCHRWQRLALESWRSTKTLEMRDFRVRERRILSDTHASPALPYAARPEVVLKRQNVRALWARTGPHLTRIDFTGAGTKSGRSRLHFLHASITWELGHIFAPNLSELVFEQVSVNADSLAEGFSQIRGLKKLVLRDSFCDNPGHEFSQAMSALLDRCPTLEELVFTHTSSSCRWLSHLPSSLRLLDLSRTRAPGLRLHAALDGTPSKFPRLHTLDLANVAMSATALNLRLLATSAPALRVLDVQYIYADMLVETPAVACLTGLTSLNFFHYDPGSQRAFVEALTESKAPCRESLRTLLVNAESLDAESVCRLGRLPRLERLCLGPSAGLKGDVLRALAAIPSLLHLLLANPRGRDRPASASDFASDSDSEPDNDPNNDF